jgi:hypothetical protein
MWRVGGSLVHTGSTGGIRRYAAGTHTRLRVESVLGRSPGSVFRSTAMFDPGRFRYTGRCGRSGTDCNPSLTRDSASTTNPTRSPNPLVNSAYEMTSANSAKRIRWSPQKELIFAGSRVSNPIHSASEMSFVQGALSGSCEAHQNKAGGFSSLHIHSLDGSCINKRK